MNRLNQPTFFAIAFAFSISLLPASAENNLISAVPASSDSSPKAPAGKTVVKTSEAAPGSIGGAPAPTAVVDHGLQPDGDTATEAAPPLPSWYSPGIEQTVKAYRSNPDEANFRQILEAVKLLLGHPSSIKLSAAMLVKDNPSLQELKPKVIEASGVRVWTFPRSPQKYQVIVQWLDSKQTSVALPHHRKKVVTTSSVHQQIMVLPEFVTVRDAGFVNNGQRLLVLAGEGENSSLWVMSYRQAEGVWTKSPEYLSSLPSFLIKDVSGHITFRNQDMIFNVARMVEEIDSTGVKRNMPEAESATYQFWLKLSESGYYIVPNLPDEDSFRTVVQFMQAIQQGRTEAAKALLVDSRIVSLLKYVGLTGKPLDPAAKVVQMSLPPSKGQRFRLINIGKDDLIFDVAKIKGVSLIKAIFAASPDPFLQETGKYFPAYARVTTQAEAKPEIPTPPADPSVKKKP